jgi:flagellar motor switch protein FliG
MEISASRDKSGDYLLEVGPVTFTLQEDSVEALRSIIDQRLNKGDEIDAENMRRKLTAYRALANKMSAVDDLIVQKFAPKVTAEQLVTIVRLSEGSELYNKIVKNMSKQNRRQFEDDYKSMEKISEHNACIYMEQLVPLIKKAAQEQKELQKEMMAR